MSDKNANVSEMFQQAKEMLEGKANAASEGMKNMASPESKEKMKTKGQDMEKKAQDSYNKLRGAGKQEQTKERQDKDELMDH
ncbi:hypothetical protein NCAS_0D04000 [Naumovozyma castellii]|uniref:Uncharacterized protein n=1 Tax=Naumovozyma castellii TaxID=27288 RepID=G0VEJ0_NAUCA|nr:hypothetical protein NCAS_0D04000 [Naumovozyma castellii CBS 4309]CCC69981.1 hypothetical protein NCAS_0D04000 [Naumovozyma castellii CBS 4309]